MNNEMLFGTISHAPLPTSFTAFLAVNVCGSDSRKRHKKHLIFKIGTIHPHVLNKRFSFI